MKTTTILFSFLFASVTALADHSSLDCSDAFARLRVHEESATSVGGPRVVTLNGISIEELVLVETQLEKETFAHEETPMTSTVHFRQDLILQDRNGGKTLWHMVCLFNFGF